MKTVTVCGSMRFKEEMMSVSFLLEAKCHFCVLQCVYNVDHLDISESDPEFLAKAHYRKIELSDAIYVLDINGYVGEQTSKEIEYAKNRGKEIIYHSAFMNGGKK